MELTHPQAHSKCRARTDAVYNRLSSTGWSDSVELEGCFSEEVTFKLRPEWPDGANVGEGAPGRGDSRRRDQETSSNVGAGNEVLWLS